MIKDQLLFTGKTTAFQSHCPSCQKIHSLHRCDLFHYQPDFEKIIKKFEFSMFQNRASFTRRKIMKVNSLDIKQKVSKEVKGWLREMLLERKKREPELRLNDPDKSSAVFSLDDQQLASSESLQTLEIEDFIDNMDRKETRNLSMHAPVPVEKEAKLHSLGLIGGEKEAKSYSSALLPIEAIERKEGKALSMLAPVDALDRMDRNNLKGLSQPIIEDLEEKPSGNSKNFIRMRSKKHSQISKESGALEKKADVMVKSQVKNILKIE